jgi:hypothetical protein
LRPKGFDYVNTIIGHPTKLLEEMDKVPMQNPGLPLKTSAKD